MKPLFTPPTHLLLRARRVRAALLSAWIAGTLPLALPAALHAADDKAKDKAAESDETELNNWLTLGVGSAFTTGDRAAFKQQHQKSDLTTGGIEEFHYEMPYQKKGSFQIDGRGIYDAHNYLLKFDLSHPDKGYIRGGFSESRNYYDGAGGWFPGNGAWFSPYPEEFTLDRSTAWLEGQYILPDTSNISFQYRHETRHGRKDSTSWGDTSLLGAGATGVRGLVPAFYDIDETRDFLTLDYRKTWAKTDWNLGIRLERDNQDNGRSELRSPGEAGQRTVKQKDVVKTDLFSLHTSSETTLREDLLLTTGFAYTTLDTDLGGSRIVVTPAGTPSLFDRGFLGLNGGSEVHQYVGHINLMATPCKDVTIVPAFRVESTDLSGANYYTDTPFMLAEQSEQMRGFLDVSQSLEIRYTGFKNWLLYTRAELLEGSGNLKERELDNTGAVSLQRNTDDDRFTQRYVAGANWYPLRGLNFAAQYYHKRAENQYKNLFDSTDNTIADRYPAFITGQDFTTDDMNIRMTWRIHPRLTLVSRYDYQLSTIDSGMDHLATVQSAKVTGHTFGETLSWTPLDRLYIQAGLNYVLNDTHTPVNDIGGSVQNVILKSQNDFWNVTLSTGYALDAKTDIRAQYSYYLADNWANNAAVGMPYGADGHEHGVSTSLTRKLTQAIRLTLRYGYYASVDNTSGNHRDFTAHLVSSSLQYRF